MGLLRVGPRKRRIGTRPACYARGGTEPTVTDADLLLGYSRSRLLPWRRMALDIAAVRDAVKTKIAGPLGLDVVAGRRGHPCHRQ